MEGVLLDLHQESSVDPSGSQTPSPQSDIAPHPQKLSSAQIIPGDISDVKSSMFQVTGDVGKQQTGDKGKGWFWSKRDRLKRDPSLDKLDEEVDGMGSNPGMDSDGKTSCPDYFGVKSYLHHFYEWPTYKDPTIYEDGWEGDDTSRLLYPAGARRGHCRCGSLCWKVCAFIGIVLLLAGAVSVLIGYLVPPKDPTVGYVGIDKQIVDRFATDFNEKLDLCKIIGLIVFCAGGLILTIALIIPSVFYRCCEDERREEAFFSVQSGDVIGPPGGRGIVGVVVPATSKLSEIQPVRRTTPEPHLTHKAPVEAHYGQPMAQRR